MLLKGRGGCRGKSQIQISKTFWRSEVSISWELLHSWSCLCEFHLSHSTKSLLSRGFPEIQPIEHKQSLSVFEYVTFWMPNFLLLQSILLLLAILVIGLLDLSLSLYICIAGWKTMSYSQKNLNFSLFFLPLLLVQKINMEWNPTVHFHIEWMFLCLYVNLFLKAIWLYCLMNVEFRILSC